MPVNSLPNNNFLDWSKFKAHAEDKINVTETLKFVLEGWKTSWEKEKMLVTSIFSLTYNVFKRLFFSWLLTFSQTSPGFYLFCSTSLLKTLQEKEKLLVSSNFYFSHSVFYHFKALSVIFIQFKIIVCKLFQFGRV